MLEDLITGNVAFSPEPSRGSWKSQPAAFKTEISREILRAKEALQDDSLTLPRKTRCVDSSAAVTGTLRRTEEV